MQLDQLELIKFRNISWQSISFAGRTSIICGPNGAGKSSILEAVYMLAHARSFRTNRVGDLIGWTGAEDCTTAGAGYNTLIKGMIYTSAGAKEVSCEIEKSRRKFSINGEEVKSASSFYGQVICAAFTGRDLELVQGPVLARRVFLDRVLALIDRAYVEHLVHYQRALKSRNLVLRGNCTQRSLMPWEDLLIKHGIYISKRRFSLVSRLNKAFRHHLEILSGGRLNTYLTFRSSVISESGECIETVCEQFRQSQKRDASRGYTTFGSHTDALEIWIDTNFGSKSVRTAASQGEARTIALALKLAAVAFLREATGEPPILLLDDAEAELDLTRRKAIYQVMAQDGGKMQAILAVTELSEELISELPGANILHISLGTIHT